ncbi:MAG: hypothetical protein V2J07_02440 [Anaerolineae bacterium]|nr:hypothetical protein [Anaerolineae bacterium]
MKANWVARIGLKFLFGILLLLSSCNLMPLTSSQEDGTEADGTVDQPMDEEEPVDESPDGEALSCFDVKALTLSVDHTLTITETETNLTHILQHGGIGLVVSNETDKGDCAISTASPQTLTYEYMGNVGTCSVEAEGNVILSAEGYCEDGIVYLNITEDWQETSGTMTCDDTVMPFPIAGYTAEHRGEFGNGEEFLIVADQAGYTIMRPFQGGDGYHSWTLAYDIELVPLTP